MITINNLVDECIHANNLKPTQKNRKKIRTKIRRVIESDPELKRLWQTAQTQVKGRTTIKLLPDEARTKILTQMQSYLKKLFYKERNVDKKQIKAIQTSEQKELNAELERQINDYYQSQDYEEYQLRQEFPTREELEKQLKSALANYESIHYTTQIGSYIQHTMIKAIFEALYTPIDTDKLIKDIALKLSIENNSYEPYEARPEEAIVLDENLRNPINHYFKKRYNADIQKQK